MGLIFTFVADFQLYLFFSFFRVGLPACLSNYNEFLREQIFVGFNEFSSHVLVQCHPSSLTTEAYSFSKSEMGFNVCAVYCVHRHRISCFKSHPRRLSNVQQIPYPKGLQQNKCWESKSNLCPSGSQIQLSTPRLLLLYASLFNCSIFLAKKKKKKKKKKKPRNFVWLTVNENYALCLLNYSSFHSSALI